MMISRALGTAADECDSGSLTVITTFNETAAHETMLPVARGRLDLGTWQRCFMQSLMGAIEARYCEAAGCRKRMISTRRFWVRPSSVALLAIG
jgi:hypothetical protein